MILKKKVFKRLFSLYVYLKKIHPHYGISIPSRSWFELTGDASTSYSSSGHMTFEKKVFKTFFYIGTYVKKFSSIVAPPYSVNHELN